MDVDKPFGQFGQPDELGFHHLHRLLGSLHAGLVSGPSVLVSSETDRRQSLVCEGEENNHHDDETIQ